MQRPCDGNIKQLCLPCIIPVMFLIRFPEDHRIELQTFGQRDRENHHAVMERGTVIGSDFQKFPDFCGLFFCPADDSDGFIAVVCHLADSAAEKFRELFLRNGMDLCRFSVADHRLDPVSALGGFFQNVSSKFGNFNGIPVTL